MKSFYLTLLMSLGSFLYDRPSEMPELLGHNFTVDQFDSDYSYTLSWNELNGEYCDCWTNVNIVAAKFSMHSGNNWYSINGAANPAGSYERVTGPNVIEDLYITVYYNGENWGAPFFCATPTGCSLTVNLNGPIGGITDPIYAPQNVTATDDVYDSKVDITWTKGTDIPNNQHRYRIYRNGALIHTTTDGNTLSYSDTGLPPDATYTYAVTTYTTSFGTHESSQFASGANDLGSTFGVGLIASDGAYLNRTNLKWNNLSEVSDEIRVERKIPGTVNKEEIAILSKNATSYNDQDGIPGYNYTYYVTPISNSATWQTDDDTGYSKPNGKISGHVRSKLNAGVSGVDIEVQILDSVPAGGLALPANCAASYCGVTDAEGYYEITNIYYYTGAEFRVVPSKGGAIPHEFSPDTVTRSLDETTKVATGVDFTDLTVYTVGGRVTYPESSNNSICGVEGVVILVDGEDFGIRTDDDGEWTFAIQEEKTYEFEPVFKDHDFENPGGDPVTTILINADNTDIDFEDVETDDLIVIVQGGCEASLADSVKIQITAPGNCFNEFYVLDEFGYLVIQDLPARDYSVQVTQLWGATNPSTIMAQIGNKTVNIDLTVRDTTEHVTVTDTTIITEASIDTLPNDSIVVTLADTVMTTLYDTVFGEVEPIVRFIYRSPLVITTNFEDAGAEVMDCPNSEGDDIIVMEQGVSYILAFDVQEMLGEDCLIDTGSLKIYDYISDRGSTPITVPISKGLAFYRVDAGDPAIASNPTFHDHEKLLYIVPEVDLLEPEEIEYWVFVTGSKGNTPSFFTKSPEIPLLVLHDPPGDKSYSYIEAGTTFTNFTTYEVKYGGEAGFYLNLLLGAKFKTPFSGHGFGTQIKFSAVGGRDNFDRDGIFTNITFTERFATSDLENLAGDNGDVYIGASFNQEYSLAQMLSFNEDSCKGFVDIVPAVSSDSFATNFVYTEKHIKSTLLPTIRLLIDETLDGRPFNTLPADTQALVQNMFGQIALWGKVLEQNRKQRDSLAVFKENISFSAGAPISRKYTNDTIRKHSFEYNAFLNTEFALGAKIDNEGGIWFNSELGVMGKFRFASATNTGNDTTETRTVGYILDDNDIGDFYSVDVKTDTAYGVPAFKMKLGTSSCPQQKGTQARDRAHIDVFPPEQTDISPDQPANFLCQITNESESLETREYAVRVVSTTNPDGLTATVGGQSIVGGTGATFYIEPFQTQNLALSFKKGPLASTYENIGIMIYPPCEYALWLAGGQLVNVDTTWINRIEWQTLCTDIALHLPDDGWLVNQQSNNTIPIAFTGYDVNNPLFQSMSLQIKKEGEGWVDQIIVEKDDITGPFYDVPFDVTNFVDGNYRLRAVANCGFEGGVTYSSEKLGSIDRSSLAPFGIPTPSDGYLREGQEVSVTFDKNINCNLNSYPNEIIT